MISRLLKRIKWIVRHGILPRPYIVYAPIYNEESGGSIALHQLCDLLNQAGQKAYIWPIGMYEKGTDFRAHYKYRQWKKERELRGNEVFRLSDNFFTPFAPKYLLKRAIVVYPEITAGNPLSSRHIVRWFLNKPGHQTGEVEYGDNEQYFYFNPQFNDRNLSEKHQLKMLHIRDDIYFETNKQERKGTCYILRKGEGREIVHDLTDSVLIDGLSHEEAAAVFNRCELCISYDQHTMLSKYAALCGCTSVVIPIEGVSKEQWRPNLEDRYGVAYGLDDIQWAKDTQKKVMLTFRQQQSRTLEQLENFIEITQSAYSGK